MFTAAQSPVQRPAAVSLPPQARVYDRLGRLKGSKSGFTHGYTPRNNGWKKGDRKWWMTPFFPNTKQVANVPIATIDRSMECLLLRAETGRRCPKAEGSAIEWPL